MEDNRTREELIAENEQLRIDLECLNQEYKELKKKYANSGRKRIFTTNDVNTMRYMKQTGSSYNDIAEHFGCSKTTVIEYLVHRKENIEIEEVEEPKTKGILGYNRHNNRFGILNNLDLWENDGLHCGTGLIVQIDGKWIADRIEMNDNDEYYLVKSKLRGEALEGVRVGLK